MRKILSFSFLQSIIISGTVYLLSLFIYCMNLSFNYCPLWLIFSKLGALIFIFFSNIADFFPFRKISEYSLALPLLKSYDENCNEVLRDIERIVLDHKSHLDIPRVTMVLNNYHIQKSALQPFLGTVVLDNWCKLSAVLLLATVKAAQCQPVDVATCIFPDFLLCIFWMEQAKLTQNKTISAHQKAQKILSL